MVMAIIYALGDVSGAHLNPAVTLAFTVRKDFPWSRLPGYWVSQVAGALLAALLLRILFGDVGHLGATLPHGGSGTSFVMEITPRASSSPSSSERHRSISSSAITPRLRLARQSRARTFASPISGASMNPARSLGPDLIAGTLGTYWIYAIGPMCGALIAVLLAAASHGGADESERTAAVGSPPRALDEITSRGGADG